jgi:hypothetical protein
LTGDRPHDSTHPDSPTAVRQVVVVIEFPAIAAANEHWRP